jgi:glycerate dehydrogenase
MKRSASLVNAARGGIVDEAALIEALDRKLIANAALDVLEQEPPPADHPLLSSARTDRDASCRMADSGGDDAARQATFARHRATLHAALRAALQEAEPHHWSDDAFDGAVVLVDDVIQVVVLPHLHQR